MPMYEYQCSECQRKEDAIRKIIDRELGPICCERAMKPLISAPMLAPILGGADFPGYACPVTDEFVSSRKRRREIMAEHNLQEKE